MSAVQKRRPVSRAKNQRSANLEAAKGKGVIRPRAWVRDTMSVLIFGAGVFLLLSLASHSYNRLMDLSPDTSRNLMGNAGNAISTVLFGGLGITALIPVFGLVWLAFFRLGSEVSRPRIYPVAAVALAAGSLVVALSTAVAIVGTPSLSGSVGAVSFDMARHALGVGGAAIATALVGLVSCAVLCQRSIGELAVGLRIVVQAVLLAITVKLPVLLLRGGLIAAGMCWWCVQNVLYWVSKLFVLRADPDESPKKDLSEPKSRPKREGAFVTGVVGAVKVDGPVAEPKVVAAVVSQTNQIEKSDPIIVKPRPRDAGDIRTLRETKVADDAKKNEADSQSGKLPQFDGYKSPELSLLSREDAQQSGDDDDELRQKAEQIELKLKDFNIAGRVTQVHPGPVITLFEFEPAAGVKVGRIAALQDDLAMSLKASSIRIIAPLPKRGTVGIEVPNKHRAVVRLRECLESEDFHSADSILSVPLGKDTYGDAVVVDIASMPHLLMAGATGTGKSVSINALLLSLLYRAHPSELGLILIDPKVLELSIYDGIPHLRVPVVTDPRQAKGVLSWAVKEMDRRYRYMQKFGVRNIDGYNRVVSGKPPIDADAPPISANAVQMQMFGDKPADADASESEGEKTTVESIAPEQLKPLPKLVIVIDELADLMLSVGREIEELITRLAQKARAAGIHLIVATQRPSVDVITGLIKANFPARLSFRVSSRIDSRTILDSMGAERLLGKGDMLFMLPGAVPLKRVHGAFVTDSEVQKVVGSLKANCTPQYDEAIIAACDKAMNEGSEGEQGDGSMGGGGSEDDFDPFYDKAVELVVEKGQASTSMIQRTFRIGYNRAARIIEMMEREGVVGKMDGVRPREVIAPSRSSEG
jgi:S-DNA-T family DNA segregation ATPase FtsK/SpoIIIE